MSETESTVLLDYYNRPAAEAEARERARRRRSLARAWWIWWSWQGDLKRYRHPAEPREHSIAFVTFWGGLAVVAIVFVLLLAANNAATLQRWIGGFF